MLSLGGRGALPSILQKLLLMSPPPSPPPSCSCQSKVLTPTAAESADGQRRFRFDSGVKVLSGSLGSHTSTSRMSYEELCALEDLREVRNPWKGLTLDRCLLLTVAVLLLSSGINELQEAVDAFMEDSGIRSLCGSLQSGSVGQIGVWDGLMWWWASEDVGAIRRRKKLLGNKGILKPKNKE